MNKRGGLTDVFVWMISSFILVIFCVLFIFIGNTVETALLEQASDIDSSLNNITNMTNIVEGTMGKVNLAYSSLKWISIMLIIGMMLSILISGYLIQVKPIFFVPYIFIIIIAAIVAAPLSNAYEVLYLNPTLASSFSGFFGVTFIFMHLPTWVLVIGFLAGIIMFINMVRGEQR